jgi:hypothetical protein
VRDELIVIPLWPIKRNSLGKVSKMIKPFSGSFCLQNGFTYALLLIKFLATCDPFGKGEGIKDGPYFYIKNCCVFLLFLFGIMELARHRPLSLVNYM